MIDRREFLQLLGIGGGAVLASARANAEAHKGVLVLGISFADTVTFDPAHEFLACPCKFISPLSPPALCWR